jgi:hypothetical protein
MKNESKAILLSALVFPGAGHVFLKKYPIALGFICASIYLLITLFNFLNGIVQVVTKQINNGEISLNIDALTQAVSSQLSELPAQYSYISYALLFLWVFAMIDAYRLGLKSQVQNK